MQIFTNEHYENECNSSLRGYLSWALETFTENDLYVTVDLPTIRTPKHYIKKSLEIIEQRVYLRRPGHLVRLPILVHNKDFPHLHMLIKNVPYSCARFPSFEFLLRTRFSKNVLIYRGVDVRPMNQFIGAVSKYSLLMQGNNVEVLVDALNMPRPSSKNL
jgi:hypothetical protein